jgi:hypothetical protein
MSVAFLALGVWNIGIVFLITAVLLLLAGFLLLGNPLARMNFQLQKPSSSIFYSNQNGYQDQFKGTNTLSGFGGIRKQGVGIVLLILGIFLMLFGAWIAGVIFVYGALRLFMSQTRPNPSSQQPTYPVSEDDQDGFEDEPQMQSGISTEMPASYIKN